MKLVFGGWLVLVLAAAGAHAQSGGPFEMKSAVIAGGGTVAASNDRHFTLTGTVGQMEAASALHSADARFAMEPGFWQGIRVVQTPGAPTLRIGLGPRDTAILSWPLEAKDFVLEETESLGERREWSLTSKAVVDTATEHTVTVSRTGEMRLFRLRKL